MSSAVEGCCCLGVWVRVVPPLVVVGRVDVLLGLSRCLAVPSLGTPNV
jgi:hypothetical protein